MKHPRRQFLHLTAVNIGAAIIATMFVVGSALAGSATLNMVLVIDGLRPDSITPEETPNLWRLRQEGVNFVNGHSVFPTVTRANATAIATGTYPGRNGMFGNQIYVRAVNPNRSFGNDDHGNLLRLDEVTGGGMVLSRTCGNSRRTRQNACCREFRYDGCCASRQSARAQGRRRAYKWQLGIRQARGIPGCSK